MVVKNEKKPTAEANDGKIIKLIVNFVPRNTKKIDKICRDGRSTSVPLEKFIGGL